jgi:hypothetical protein
MNCISHSAQHSSRRVLHSTCEIIFFPIVKKRTQAAVACDGTPLYLDSEKRAQQQVQLKTLSS